MNMKHLWKLISFSLLPFLMIAPVAGETRMLKSSPSAIMLELYTSQGCYSCPPAEKWINKFKQDTSLWNTLIPINLHVDYWDYLGWKDPYAFNEFSQRQRQYKRYGHTQNVATPGFVVNGHGWNGWFRGHDVPHKYRLNQATQLSAELDQAASTLTIQFVRDQLHPDAKNLAMGANAIYANIALLGFDIKTEIPLGENTGKTLDHDFVVVAYSKVRLNVKSAGAEWEKSTYLPSPIKQNHAPGAIAVWISTQADPKPVQALGGWI